MKKVKIVDVGALEILDSRGLPTLYVEVRGDNGIMGSAAVPSGASTGEHEALELRDSDPRRFLGKGVKKAVSHVRNELKAAILGHNLLDQQTIDSLLCEADGTENKQRYGANAILGISLATCRAASLSQNIPLYRYIGGEKAHLLPCPMMNLINGGAHADNGLEFQEFMIRPWSAPSFSEALRWGAEVFHHLKRILHSKNLATGVGDEGGFAPKLKSNEEALELLLEAIESAGYKPGDEISLALDCAASQFYRDGHYSGKTAREQVDYLEHLCTQYPIDSIEDGLAENDWEGWRLLNKTIGRDVQIVGDDLFVTNLSFLKRGVEEKSANAILIKLNQIGTLSETLACIEYAQDQGLETIISHRSGETCDTFISDLAVAVNSGQIKCGSLARSERTAKYNRLLLIESELAKKGRFGI